MKTVFTCSLMMAANFSFSQAGNVGIGTNTPIARLHVAGGSVVFSMPGQASNSPVNLPISGSGRRMLWYADRAAFRAGCVTDNQWDKDSIGNYSFATGFNTMAMGIASAALGVNTRTIGAYSLALGFSDSAIGSSSVAIGSYSSAIGNNSVAIGLSARATSSFAFAFGANAEASGEFSFSLGSFSKASGIGAITIGRSSTASGDYSTAMGAGTLANGGVATALGNSTIASGESSTSMGVYTEASGNFSTALGFSNRAASVYETVIGSYALPYTPASKTEFSTADRQFVVGNGTADNERSNALTILKNGNTGIGTATPTEKLEVAGKINTPVVTTPFNSGNNMLAAAYGVVYSNGILQTSSGNCTINAVHTTGIYILTFTSANLSAAAIGNLPVVVSLYGAAGAPGFITWHSMANGVLTIYTYNASGVLADRGFSFAVYKP